MARRIDEWPARLPRRVLIVDDHPVVREGLAEILNEEKDLRVCGSAGSAAQALKGVARLDPDIVLLDISLPDQSGLELIKELRARNPRVKLLVVSMHDEALYAERVLELGGDGYIMKQADPAEIVQAMRDVLDDHIYVSKSVLTSRGKGRSRGRRASAPARPLGELTDQELEILELVGLSKGEEAIAKQMGLSLRAVHAHCEQIKSKLNLKTDKTLARFAISWIEGNLA